MQRQSSSPSLLPHIGTPRTAYERTLPFPLLSEAQAAEVLARVDADPAPRASIAARATLPGVGSLGVSKGRVAAIRPAPMEPSRASAPVAIALPEGPPLLGTRRHRIAFAVIALVLSALAFLGGRARGSLLVEPPLNHHLTGR
jgi:hypothetical protein